MGTRGLLLFPPPWGSAVSAFEAAALPWALVLAAVLAAAVLAAAALAAAALVLAAVLAAAVLAAAVLAAAVLAAAVLPWALALAAARSGRRGLGGFQSFFHSRYRYGAW